MLKVHNTRGKLVCIIPRRFTVEIKDRYSITIITFDDDGKHKIESYPIKKMKT